MHRDIKSYNDEKIIDIRLNIESYISAIGKFERIHH